MGTGEQEVALPADEPVRRASATPGLQAPISEGLSPEGLAKRPGRVADAAALFYVLLAFIPWRPLPWDSIGLPSWLFTLHVAFSDGLRFGRDIVFTFGPWGFIYDGYHPSTYTVLVLAWAGLAVAFWCGGKSIGKGLGLGSAGSALWLIGLAAIATLNDTPDTRLYLLAALLLLAHFTDPQLSGAAEGCMAAALALASLAKFSCLVAVCPIVALVAADELWIRRRLPRSLAVFLGALCGFWILARQDPLDFPVWLRNSARIVEGYSGAMQLRSATEHLDVALYLLGATFVGTAAAVGLLKRLAWRGILPLAGVTWLLFIFFKAGYVRHDYHEFTATTSLLALSLLVLGVTIPCSPGKASRCLSCLPVAAAFLLASRTWCLYQDQPWFQPRYSQVLALPNLPSAALTLVGAGSQERDHEAGFSALRSKAPLPILTGSVDIFPWGDEPLLGAHRADYRPRPVFESYSAYTPDLARMNAAHLASQQAPDHVVFSVKKCDDRLPSMEDGLCWPLLLARYKIVGAAGPHLLLRLSERMEEWRLNPVSRLPLKFGAPVRVPDLRQGPLWAAVDLNVTMSGRVLSGLYKPPAVKLLLKMAGGGSEFATLVPGVAREGFLLSPLILSTADFVRLASLDWREGLAGSQVDELSLWIDPPEAAGYDGTSVTLTLSRLDFRHQDLRGVPAVR